MKQQAASWNATAAYRLGLYWQGAGDFEHAEAAYQAVLSEIKGHAPTLFNLSVTQIRLDQCDRALRTMNDLAEVAKGGIPGEDDPEKFEVWSAVGCSVAYNRALAWHYLKEHAKARKWSLSLGKRVLAPREPARARDKALEAELRTLERLEWSALMLHASISAAKLDTAVLSELHEGALHAHTLILPALDAELDIDAKGRDDPEREHERRARLRDRLSEPSVAKLLEWYVRWRAGGDVRTRYNLACYVARLAKAATDHEMADKLRQRGIDHATFALRDDRLAAWAKQDPALAPLKRHDQWPTLVAEAPAVGPEPTATDGAAGVRPESDRAAAAQVGRPTVIEQARLLLTQACVPPPPASEDGLDRLGARAEGLSDAAFERELTSLYASAHDPMAVYVRQRPTIAAIPVILERCVDGDETRFLVAEVGEDYAADLPRATQVTHWNGVPIAAAVEQHTGLIGAATAEARSARSIASLTHWPIDLLGPPETDTVTLRFRRDGVDDEVRLRWSRTTHTWDDGRLLSIDPLTEAVRRSRSRVLRRTHWNGSQRMEGVIDSRRVPGRIEYGHLRLLTFDVEDADAFVDEVAHAVEHLPPEGLIIDVRGNGGGRIEAAERLLQLFTPRYVKPRRLQARATDLMARVARASPDLQTWRGPLESALRAERPLTEPFDLTAEDEASCTRVGQIYHGPVGLIVDALCGGATDFFVAGFIDNAIGPITSVDEPSGNGPRPAEAWSHAFLRDLLRGHPLERLPDRVGFRVPVRRGVHTGWGELEPHHHRRTRLDLVEDDRDLLAAVAGRLAGMPVRVLRAALELRPGKRIEGAVETKELSRVRLLVDGEERLLLTQLADGKHRVELDVEERDRHEVELRGEGPGDVVLARRRVTLGGV